MMRILLPALAALSIAACLFAARASAEGQKEEGSHEGKKLFHVVSLKFKDGAKPEQVKAVEEAFAALKEKVPGISALTWGTNVSPENHAKGFTHCFILAFNSAKDRDAYLVHPEHRAFGKVLGPVMGDVFVIDFWGDVSSARNLHREEAK